MSPRKTAAALAALSTAVAFALGFGQIRASAPTYDEPVHLASGYLALATPAPPLNWRDHPPFAECWAALPLAPLGLTTFSGLRASSTLYDFADVFLYRNRASAERLLDTARAWCLLSWSAALAFPLAAWALALCGPAGAAAAALGAAFCPPLYSNAALATTDSAAAVFYFLTFFALSRRPRKRAHWAAAGLCAGLALASKFSMIVLPPVAAVMLLSEARLEPARKARVAEGGLFCALLVCALAAATFGRLSLFWDGLTRTLTRLDAGRASYLLGHYSTSGFALYFPVAVLVKTPLPLLLLAAGGAAMWARRPTVDVLWVCAPPAAYFLAACFSKTDIGGRHVLPVYPFLILTASAAAAELWKRGRAARGVALALGVWLACSAARAAPDSLAYFNELAGGADGGWRVLLDSNLDWGQGLKPLGEELRRRGDPAIFLSYFGTADPSYYGVRYYPLAWFTNVARREGVALPDPQGPLLFAVSATNLEAVYFADHSLFSWLDPAKAVARPGRSIFLFDLTNDPAGRAHLAALLAASGAPPQVQAVALGGRKK